MALLRELAEARAQRSESLLETLVQWLFTLWGAADFSGSGEEELIDDTVEAVLDTMLQARRDTDDYMRAVFQDQGIEYPKRNMPPAASEIYPRHGITPEEVWARPLREYRNARAKGDSHQQALLKTQKRVRQIADSEIKLAQREREARTYERSDPDEVIGYRRIIHPELSRTGTCGLCLVAADRIYYVKQLYPLHDNCKCETLPITKSHDPGLKLNREDLDYIYDIAGSTGKQDLSNTRIVDYVSGETGPQIARRVQRSYDGMTPRNRRHAVKGDQAKERSEVPSGGLQFRRAKDEMSALRRQRSRPRRRRVNALEDSLRYWKGQQGEDAA